MRLLIIEDDAEIANLLGRYLERQGFVITVVADGEAGIQAFSVADVNVYDVVLTDGLLPRKNGYEVCTAIRALPHGKKVGIVLMTAAFRGAKARSDAYSRGIDAYFTKPFVLAELRDKLVELACRSVGTPAVARPPDPTTTTTTTTTTTPPAPALAPRAPVRSRKLEAGAVSTPAAVAGALMLAARQRFDGVVRFVSGDGALEIAFMRGVVVGAGDNMGEHALGAWLLRKGRLSEEQAAALNARLAQTRERVAEALLALGFVTATEALGLVDMQVHARVRRALLWNGRIELVDGVEAAEPLAMHALSLVDVLLGFALEPGHAKEAEAFAAARATEVLERTADFDSGLVAFARLRPTSSLPQLLLERPATVGEAIGRTDALEVWALWFAGLLHAQLDPPPDARSVPRAFKASAGTGGLVDDDAVARLSRVLLKARHATVYQLLDLPTSTSREVVLQALLDLVAAVGQQALGSSKLGPASSSARELWTLLDDYIFVFSDDRRRQAYDDEERARPAPARRAWPPPT